MSSRILETHHRKRTMKKNRNAIVVPEAAGAISLAQSFEKAKPFLRTGKSQNTERAYRFQWDRWSEWCRARRLNAEALTDVAGIKKLMLVYLGERAANGEAPRTLVVARAAILKMYGREGVLLSLRDDPNFKEYWDNLLREMRWMPHQKKPLLPKDLEKCIEYQMHLPKKLRGLRNATVLVLGFYSACRRSEIVDFDVPHLDFSDPLGLRIHLPHSKTDQTGKGRKVPIERQTDTYCPLEFVDQWLNMAKIKEGPVFRSIDRFGNISTGRMEGNEISRIVKESVAGIGLDPSGFGAHSLRAGFCTAAAMQDVPFEKIMDVTGHLDARTVKMYIRMATMLRNTAGGAIKVGKKIDLKRFYGS